MGDLLRRGLQSLCVTFVSIYLPPSNRLWEKDTMILTLVIFIFPIHIHQFSSIFQLSPCKTSWFSARKKAPPAPHFKRHTRRYEDLAFAPTLLPFSTSFCSGSISTHNETNFNHFFSCCHDEGRNRVVLSIPSFADFYVPIAVKQTLSLLSLCNDTRSRFD